MPGCSLMGGADFGARGTVDFRLEPRPWARPESLQNFGRKIKRRRRVNSDGFRDNGGRPAGSKSGGGGARPCRRILVERPVPGVRDHADAGRPAFSPTTTGRCREFPRKLVVFSTSRRRRSKCGGKSGAGLKFIGETATVRHLVRGPRGADCPFIGVFVDLDDPAQQRRRVPRRLVFEKGLGGLRGARRLPPLSTSGGPWSRAGNSRTSLLSGRRILRKQGLDFLTGGIGTPRRTVDVRNWHAVWTIFREPL